MTSPFEFHSPSHVLFGHGRVAELSAWIPAEAQRILLVTDEVISTKTAILEQVMKALHGRDIRLVDRVEENPSLATVEAGGKKAREEKVQCVIGLGGGSPLDAAKGMALLATNGGLLKDYLTGKALQCDPLPVVAVPTTSGTGSEVTPYAVFTDPGSKNKLGYGHSGLFPKVAVVDPELTYSMPPSVIVNTGLDVLSHAVEAYLSTLAFPLNDAIALHAIDVVLEHLPRAAGLYHESMDHMAAAATAAGIAITHASTILPHIMGYPLTVFHGVPHGRASAIMMAHVLKHLDCPGKLQVLEARFAPQGGVESFLSSLGVSIKLSDYGVRKEELALYAQKTIVKGDVKITPATITAEWLVALYTSAM